MKKKDIVNGIKARLAATPDRPPTAWPNVDFDPNTVPRFEVSFPSRETTDGTLKAGGSISAERGLMRVVICTEKREGEDAGNDYLDAIMDLFPEGQRFDITGGRVTVTQPTTIDGPAFEDETCFRLPVRVSYLAVST